MQKRVSEIRSAGAVLLISCYELGRQPMGVAMPLGVLERAGFSAEAIDVSVETMDVQKVMRARFVGISVPMHTALRLGDSVVERVRTINPDAIICLYGLYAGLNSDYLLKNGVDFCITGEYEEPLLALIQKVENHECSSSGDSRLDMPEGIIGRSLESTPFLQRTDFPVPSRRALPSLRNYSRLEHQGEQRLIGYVEASRGCKHVCTHCPIPPVYGGRFFAIPQEVVMEDISRQVDAGATHISFGDPDFLNGPTHSLRLVRKMHEKFSSLTFDFVSKIEHILKHRTLFPELSQLGCLFTVSAVESLSDTVLKVLKKSHTRADVKEAIAIVHSTGISLRPTWLAFTPWTTLGDYLEMLEFVERHRLIDHVDPVQYTIRLLVPPGSLLLNSTSMKTYLGTLDQSSFSYRWEHPNPQMDELYKAVNTKVEKNSRLGVTAEKTFHNVWELAAEIQGETPPRHQPLSPNRIRAPRLTEPWFC